MASPAALAAVAALRELYTASASLPYGSSGADLPVNPLAGRGGAVGFLAHAEQCAALAAAGDPGDDELVAAALLHDVGWLLPKPSDRALLTGGADASADGVASADSQLCRLA